MFDVDAAIKTAIKAREKDALAGYRSLKARIGTKLTEAGRGDKPLAEDELEALIRREVKERRESNEYYQPGQGDYDKNARIIELLEAHLPKALSPEAAAAAVQKAIADSGAAGTRDMGRVMGALKQIPGVDMKAASAQVREALAKLEE
ncbi:MAG: GatB/YqeY domain-containing protein [bacterium]